MAAAGRETEIKLRIESAGEARKRIEAAGFEIFRPRVFEANLLLDTAVASLQTAGETLRVRERGGETILTYKGPVERDRHKSRQEIETSAGEAPALLAILARLGFAPSYRYEKFRTEYARRGEPGIRRSTKRRSAALSNLRAREIGSITQPPVSDFPKMTTLMIHMRQFFADIVLRTG